MVQMRLSSTMERKAEGDNSCGAAVQVLDTLKEDGAMFDVVLDTVGGKEVREAIKKKCVDRYKGAANMTNLEDLQWTSVTTAHDSGRLNLNLASITTPTPSVSLITITMKFFTIFIASWFIVLTVWFLDPRKPGEFFLTYCC